MRRPSVIDRPSLAAAFAGMFVLGCALVAYATWTRPLADADAAIRRGDLEEAARLYGAAEARFDRLPFVKELFRPDYERVAANRVWVAYAAKRLDETIEQGDRLGGIGPSRFWAGCALFGKARAEPQARARLAWIGRAREEFRGALEAAPGDWDAKFNYEVTTRLLAGLRKGPRKASEPVMRLLEPQDEDPLRRPVRKVG